MMRFNLNALLLLILVLLTTPRAAHAAESYDNCTGFIASLPAVISTQGTWCFNKDLNTAIATGNAITVATNNVTIDCNNFKLGGLAAGIGTQTTGIVSVDHVNTTVRHCNIRGFWYGLWFTGTIATNYGHVIEDNRFDGNTFVGLAVESDSAVVRRNRVTDTGGSTLGPDAYGILSQGSSIDFLDNTVSGVAARSGAGGNATGIRASSDGGSISGNRVREVVKDGAGIAVGITNNDAAGGRVILTENHVVGDASALSVGLLCSGANNRAKDNVIGGFATGIQTCGDAGGNDITP